MSIEKKVKKVATVIREVQLLRSVADHGPGDYFLEDNDSNRFFLDSEVQKEMERANYPSGTRLRYTIKLTSYD